MSRDPLPNNATDPPAAPISLVVFDLGGVIVRICRSWAEGCRAAGVPVRYDEGIPETSLAAPEMLARRREVSGLYQEGRIACEDFFSRMSATTAPANGPPLYTPDEVRRIHHAWTLDEYPGVGGPRGGGGLIERVHSAGLVTGVLSNTNHAHWQRMAPPAHMPDHLVEYPTPRRLRHLHASHLLGLSKPGLEIYRAFERLTGYEGRSAQILFFDDLEENVAAARAVGWRAHLIDHTGDTAAQMGACLRSLGVL